MTATKLPNLNAYLVKTYQDGAGSTVIIGSENELPNLSYPDTGITGSFMFERVLEPSKRIQKISEQGAVFDWCKDGGNIGAWFADENGKTTAHSAVFVNGEWTWKDAEYKYLAALLSSRGNPSDYQRSIVEPLKVIA